MFISTMESGNTGIKILDIDLKLYTFNSSLFISIDNIYSFTSDRV